MKSVVKTALVVLVSMLLVIVLYKIISRINFNENNIFDEMYYGEKKVYKWGANTPFSSIPGIHQWNRNDFMVYSDIKELSDKNNTVKERYEKKYKTKKIGEWTIRFVFEFKEGEREVYISFINEDKEKKIGIGIFISYKVDTKIMKERIRFFDKTKNKPEGEIDEIPKIKEYLEKNNISIKDLKETADELLYEKVIGDWKKYANSRYSKDNLGNVKIERSPLFDGVD